MSGAQRPSGCSERAGDAAAYALGALEPGEAAAFERHLETCAGCREELRAFEQAVQALPGAVPQYEAPPALRRKVLGDFRSAQRAAHAGGGRERERATRRRRPARAPRAALPRRALVTGALAALALAAVLIAALPGSGTTTRTIAARVVGTPGTAELRLSGSHAELVVAHLPAPAAGHVYEMWLLRGHRTAPSTLFSVGPHGRAAIEVQGDLHAVSDVLVTQEPAGGTSAPTSAPLIVAPLD